jgi:hypothetical protein
VARKGTRKREELPPALPPETRTVGQLVAETLKLYGRHVWASLALGLGPAATAVGVTFIPGWWDLGFVLTGGALLMTASYVGGVVIAAEARPTVGAIANAVWVGYLIFLPVPFLYSVVILPAVVWLGFVGLAVPAALLEGRRLLDALRRGFELARADPIHAVGSLATLVIVSFLTATVLFVLLRGGSKIALSSAAFCSLVFISPILFLGAGLLYFDQAARVESARPRSRRSRDADVHLADDPDRSGRADAESEPRPAAGGQP